MRHISKIRSLEFPPFVDWTAATQLLSMYSVCDTLSSTFDVAKPLCSVTVDSAFWVPGWQVPVLKLVNSSIHINDEDTHALHQFDDDLFALFQGRLTSTPAEPAVFKTLLSDIDDHFVAHCGE